MIESRVLYRSSAERDGEAFILGTMFKNKLIYTSIVVGRRASGWTRASAEVEAARQTLQVYSGCTRGSGYYEVVVGTLVAVPIAVHTALQRAKKDRAVLFLVANVEIRKAVLVSLNVQR